MVKKILMYNRLLSGLLQAWYLPVVTFRDTPRKLTALKFFFASYTKTKISIKYLYKIFSNSVSLGFTDIFKTS